LEFRSLRSFIASSGNVEDVKRWSGQISAPFDPGVVQPEPSDGGPGGKNALTASVFRALPPAPGLPFCHFSFTMCDDQLYTIFAAYQADPNRDLFAFYEREELFPRRLPDRQPGMSDHRQHREALVGERAEQPRNVVAAIFRHAANFRDRFATSIPETSRTDDHTDGR